MEYVNLGKTGLPVSRLSFGSWITFGNQIQNQISERLMDIAYEIELIKTGTISVFMVLPS